MGAWISMYFPVPLKGSKQAAFLSIQCLISMRITSTLNYSDSLLKAEVGRQLAKKKSKGPPSRKVKV